MARRRRAARPIRRSPDNRRPAAPGPVRSLAKPAARRAQRRPFQQSHHPLIEIGAALMRRRLLTVTDCEALWTHAYDPIALVSALVLLDLPEWLVDGLLLALTQDDPGGPRTRVSAHGADTIVAGTAGRVGRWYHASVHNLHRSKVAVNATVYVKEIRDGSSSRRPATIEVVWMGYSFASAAILPQSSRAFDLGVVWLDRPDEFVVVRHATTASYREVLRGPGEFDVDYTVIAENMPETTWTARICLGRTVDDVQVTGHE
jgi:hypothetical protein